MTCPEGQLAGIAQGFSITCQDEEDVSCAQAQGGLGGFKIGCDGAVNIICYIQSRIVPIPLQ